MTRRLLLETAHHCGNCRPCHFAASTALLYDYARIDSEVIQHSSNRSLDHWAVWRVVPEEDA